MGILKTRPRLGSALRQFRVPSVLRITDAGFVVITELSNYPENDVKEGIKNCPAECIYREEK